MLTPTNRQTPIAIYGYLNFKFLDIKGIIQKYEKIQMKVSYSKLSSHYKITVHVSMQYPATHQNYNAISGNLDLLKAFV